MKTPLQYAMRPSQSGRISGVSLIGIIAALVLMGLLSAGVLIIVSTATMESVLALNWSQAFFAAETGLSAAKAYLGTNASWYTQLPYTNRGAVGPASFTAIVDSNGQISSTGYRADAQWTSRWQPDEIPRALAVYRQTGQFNPRYRACSNLRRLSNEQTAASAGNNIFWQRLAASPRTNEFLLAVQNSARQIWVQTYANGAWFSNTLLNAAGPAAAANARGFDVAYESLSGRGLAVYSIGSSNPQYRLWISNSWTAAGAINVGATNPVQWIRLVAKPGSDEIMCLARWRKTANPAAGGYSSAIIWDGSGWTNYIPLERWCASQTNCETMDAAYAADQALAIYVNGNTAAARQIPKYRIFNAVSGTWSGESNMVSLGADPRWIRAEYNPDGTLAYAGFSCYVNASTRRLRGTYRRNNNWDAAYNTFSNVNIYTVTYRCFDIAWSSQTNTLMAAYNRNLATQSYLLAAGGGTSNYYGNMVSSGASDRSQWCVLKPDPFTSEFYCLMLDNQNDVNLQRWHGAAWSLFPEPENLSAVAFNSIDLAFRRDSASTNCWR